MNNNVNHLYSDSNSDVNDNGNNTTNRNNNIVNVEEESSSLPLNTKHELDAYEKWSSSEVLSVLSKLINFQIGEQNEQVLQNIHPPTLQQDQINATNTTSLPLAGRLKFHLVSECTIVVESVLQMPPLDEGTLLVIQIPNIIIPLRKIFEVFGPVARPLYTLRIPPPPSNTTTMKKLNTTITVTATDAVAEEYQNQKKSTELDPPN